MWKLLGLLRGSSCRRLEGINKIKTGKLVSLSEQELIDCDANDGNLGCLGGYMEKAFTFIKKNGGLTTERDYPYKGTGGTCDKRKAAHHAVTISSHENVPADNEEKLKAAAAHQPVSVAIDAGSSFFQLHSEGIFTGICGKDLDHGVTIVGYGEDNGQKGLCGIAMLPSYPVK
ncbi:hypothetical protein K1719_027225 [Acacia pycnantha]|nr:hypothetical protein K1719_027225 [Acacia pycnantha]